MTISPLADEYIAGYPGHVQGWQIPLWLVVHCTVSACVAYGSRGIAQYFQSPASGGLAHLVVDPAHTVATLDEEHACWGAPPNPGEVHLELCDPQTGPASRWADGDHQQMLHRAARVAADFCRRRALPVQRCTPAMLLAGQPGMPGHVDVSQAYGQSDHRDPGYDFPWTQWLDLVHGYGTPGPAPLPAPPPPPPAVPVEDTMRLVKPASGGPAVWLQSGDWVRQVTRPEINSLVAAGVVDTCVDQTGTPRPALWPVPDVDFARLRRAAAVPFL